MIKNFLKEVGFRINDINQLPLKYRNIFLEEYEHYLGYIIKEKVYILYILVIYMVI